MSPTTTPPSLNHTAVDARCPQQTLDHLSCATGQPISGPSYRDPHFNGDAALDRWASLVEVCASTSPASLSALSPSPQLQPLTTPPKSPHFAPSQLPMVQAPLSDVEDEFEPRSLCLSPLHNEPYISRNRKKHACELCDKAFDRPSTLKTHLLVHTGITPFSCHLCGRRFGVQSNCNRHIRRCVIREELFVARRFEFQALQSKTQDTCLEIPHSPRTPSYISRSVSPTMISKPKRPRRKRSPAATWIPHSLASFTIPTICSPAPLPLPPVRPKATREERDSYILYHDQPYTKEGWSGRLPGPAPLFGGRYVGAVDRSYTPPR